MDVYRALNADVPQLLFTVMHQAGPTVSDEEFTRTVTALQMDIRKQVHEVGERLHQWPLHEAWLLFRGSIHYDVMEHIVRDRLGIYRGSHGAHIQNIARTSFGTYNLIYQLGESLTADLVGDVPTQEVTFAFSKGPIHYSDFRHEVSALMEHIAEQINLKHASFWQRKLGLGTGKEFGLRLRLPLGEEPLRVVMSVIAGAGSVGKETIVKRGKLMLGKRVF